MGQNNNDDSKDMLYLMGGAALMILGAGLIMTNKSVRNAVTAGASSIIPDLQGKMGFDISAIGEDVQRYMKLRSM